MRQLQMTTSNRQGVAYLAVRLVENRQGSVKCFDIETGKTLHHRTVTQLPWSRDSHLIEKVEGRGLR